MNKLKKLPFELKPPLAVLGYGAEGRYAVSFLLKNGLGPITVFDQKPQQDVPAGVEFQLCGKDWEPLEAFGTVLRSPGVHYDLPRLRQAKDAGAQVTSLTDLSFQVARSRITAITGSNGKTTTTNLTAHLLSRRYGEKLILGGNDHQPILDRLIQDPDSPAVMEVSSFQFADLRVSPGIAAILNITPNHLDWHENLDDYANAKRNLILHQQPGDWAVLNANDENSAKFAPDVKGNLLWVGQAQGSQWILWKEGKLVAKWEGQKIEFGSREQISLKTHQDNLAFAAGLGLIHGLEPAEIFEGLISFPGTPQRLEYVGQKDGVSFYNDSACTTPESAQVALREFPSGKLIVLLGGSSKNSEFDYLALDLKRHQTRVWLYGAEGDRIRSAIEGQDSKDLILGQDRSGDFEGLVRQAFASAQPEDAVVLSPACASFDLFKNSKDRGAQFKSIVLKLLSE